jgi:hypothetical protein
MISLSVLLAARCLKLLSLGECATMACSVSLLSATLPGGDEMAVLAQIV